VSFAGAGSLFARFDNLKLQEASLVDVPPERRPGGEAELALSSPSPNPARGAVAVWLSLPAARPATLTLLDVAGRAFEQHQVGELGPGRHRVAFDAAPRLPAGIYLIRLQRGAEARTGRVIVLR